MLHSTLLFLGDIGGSELILIMVVILVFFGANKIPELARGLGKGIREFKDASTEIRSEFERAGQQPPYNPNQAYNPNPGYNPNYPPQPAPYAGQPAPGYEPLPVADAHPAAGAPAEPAYVPPVLPPNLAPEGTQPRQPYSPPSV
ncbi:twin-arginine translocase TatA/TatE family subunit [Hymenobacter caeli]|uniref:Sec-independent protein translocase protein TatA n=1 Tax=Hymenobacter caeli TaxID=2735894 RepID=A0ABX2FLG2_9BACT|nr:twin-arginine translocase TatA/TatE family subunit [Hymenobacter caeli]NRT17978.1 sec-independent protein translocase protein TatA [Hymenobacter caeli]